jgi:hypothetical protein
MNNVFMNPSLYAHMLNGLLLLVSVIIIYKNYKKIIKLDYYKLLILILLVSLVVGVHGLSHLGLEYIYGLSPINIIKFLNHR